MTNHDLLTQLINYIDDSPGSTGSVKKHGRLYIQVVGCPLSRWGIRDVQVIQTFSRDGQIVKFWDISGTHLEHIWDISWTYMGHI